jgi:nucleoside-diphosphate-sugar epimerase
MSVDLPETIRDVESLEELLSRPTEPVAETMAHIHGDILVLGAAGKMGPTLARMACRASQAAGSPRKIIGVSRFTHSEVRVRLNACGVETIQGDLLNPAFLSTLPDAANVIIMAGTKFGTTGNEPLTWASNAWLPTLVCRRYAGSRIVAFSTGNVYGNVPVASGGSRETDPLRPCGEYAMSCLGRERMFQYFSQELGIPTVLVRLNYAVETRYGVLVDLARKVYDRLEIDLSMGFVNVIWQGDAVATSLAALVDASCPPLILNVGGPEVLRVRDVCETYGRLLKRDVRFAGRESRDALLSNAQAALQRYGQPRVGVDQMVRWIADWLIRGGPILDKPTHFEVRNGSF